MRLLFESFYFMLPAYMANLAPQVVRWVPFGATAINKRLLGNHKTYRGLIFGVAAGLAVILLQRYLQNVPIFASISLIDYTNASAHTLIALGVAFSLGALLGDAVKSFFKRRAGIPPGKSWIPFDQLDFVIGSLLAVSFFVSLSWTHIIIILFISPLLHTATNLVGFYLGIKKNRL